MKKERPLTPFRFRHHQLIGAAAAEDDTKFLQECFVETKDLAILSDVSDSRCLLVGRTGAGKSALLARLIAKEEHVIVIRPESLALNYISNSTIMKYLSELGVRLDVFFRLLWKHVLTVRLIEERYGEKRPHILAGLVDKIRSLHGHQRRVQRAILYIEKHGDSFWKNTEDNLREMTQSMERQVDGAFVASSGLGSLNLSTAKKMTEEQKRDFIHRAQEIVNSEQVRELEDLYSCMAHAFFVDPVQRFYVVIDKLDTDWVEEELRLRLVHALTDTAKDFTSEIPGVKVIVALRQDLLDQVNSTIVVAGQQREKQQSSILELRWNRDELVQILDKRIDFLVRHQFTNTVVTHRDLLPATVGGRKGVSGIEYMLERTLYRPRDIILFFNACIEQSNGKATITATDLKLAESRYSRSRVDAIKDEWGSSIRNIDLAFQLVDHCPGSFPASLITKTRCNSVVLDMLTNYRKSAIIFDALEAELTTIESLELSCRSMMMTLFRVGVIGFKLAPGSPVCWSYDRVSVLESAIQDDTMVHVHPTFWQGLGISFNERDNS